MCTFDIQHGWKKLLQKKKKKKKKNNEAIIFDDAVNCLGKTIEKFLFLSC